MIEIPPVPNCVVTVLFDRHRATFSYTCSSRSPGWQVLADGNIIPPSVARIVQFRVKSWPPEESSPLGKSPSFAAFQVVPAGQDLPPKEQRWPALPSGVESVITQIPTAESAETPVVTLNFGRGRWSYRLAVTGAEGEPIWDDPKIHDDGSDW